MFRADPGVFDAFREVPSDEPRTVSSAMRRLVCARTRSLTDIGDIPWADVDTPADREVAERVLASSNLRSLIS